jgi:hypothetical protein
MKQAPNQTTPGRRQTAAFAVVCLSVVAAGAYLAAVHGSDWRAGRRLPETGALTYALIAAACLFAAVAAWFGRRYFNKTAVVFIAAAAGGLTTAGYHGLLGAIPGGVVGMLIAFHIGRRIGVALLVSLAAVGFGILSGTLALWLDPDLSDGPGIATTAALVVALAVSVAGLVRWRRANVATSWRRWSRRLGNCGLVTLIVAGLWLSLSVDKICRVRRLSDNIPPVKWDPTPWSVLPYWVVLRPLSAEWLWPGPLLVQIQFVVRPDATDDDLRALRGWTELYHLEIPSPAITDRGLEWLQGLKGLRSIELNGSQITGQGLNHLPLSYNVRINHATFINEDLLSFGHPGQGNSLSLNDWRPRAEYRIARMRDIPSSPVQMDLDLSRSRFSKGALGHLANLTLGRLDLSSTTVTDEDLAALKGCRSISDLNLYNTRITNAGVEVLKSIPTLQSVNGRGNLHH